MNKGKFITLEGIEGSGKSVQSKKLLEYLEAKGVPVILKREPGGTLCSEALRGLIKNPDLTIPAIFNALKKHEDYKHLVLPEDADFSRTAECELFLFLASGAEFSAKAVKPALQAGTTVIGDRFRDSTLAYQGGGRFNADPEMIEFIQLASRISSRDIWPDLTLILDVPLEVMKERISQDHPDKQAYFEKTCNQEFFQKAMAVYRQLAEEEPERCKLINGVGTPEEVFKRIKSEVDKFFNWQGEE